MKKIKNNKGITMLTLVITVFVLVIIAGTAVYTGRDVLNDAKKEAFVQELQIIQNAVNNEHSKIGLASLDDENEDGAIDYIYNITWTQGKDIPDNLPSVVQNIIGEGNGYRYFEKSDLIELGINGITQPVLINFTTRDVISVNGFDGKYTLSEFNGTTNYNSTVILEIDNVPIPNGFVYLTGSKDEGLTIKNIKDGNEFVWVPVTSTADWSAPGIQPSDGEGTTDRIDSDWLLMKESVDTYNGFYVGRYETSYDGTKVRSVGNVRPLYQTQVIDGNVKTTWYTFYTKQKELYNKTSDSVVSGMIYYGQWDAIMEWMKDVPNIKDSTKLYINYSTDMGNYSWVPIDTGSRSAFAVKNIYDLAGNYREWTQKTNTNNTSYRISRGSDYGDDGSSFKLTSIGISSPNYINSEVSSRLQLYIKVPEGEDSTTIPTTTTSPTASPTPTPTPTATPTPTPTPFEPVESYTSDGVPIPKGFALSPYSGESSKDTGVVIYELNDNETAIPSTETKETSLTTRNQFVWVPVDTFSDFAVLQSGSTTNYRGQLWATGTGSDNVFGTKNTTYNENSAIKEPGIATGGATGTENENDGAEANIKAILETDKYSTLLEQFQSEYNDMAKSVKKYSGFYVGRYETNASYGSTKGVTPVNAKTWYKLYQGQKELYNQESDSVVSGMIYGSQWDAIMNWMANIPSVRYSDLKYIKCGLGMGNHSPSTEPTGYYAVNNIYDLAGNYWEWTQEESLRHYRVIRGGDYNGDTEDGNIYLGSHGPSFRDNLEPTTASTATTSRLQLYIKVAE